jgi:ubiquinone/menaquinone biosynthesis C-methylase UbiE
MTGADLKREEIDLHKKLSEDYKGKRYKFDFSRDFHSFWNEKLLEDLPENAKILDAGGGTGILSESLRKRSDFVVCLDLSFDMLSKIRTDIVRLCSDMENTAIKDGIFDVVVCRGSLHHLNDLRSGLKEIWRVLKKDGLFLMSETSDAALLRSFRRLLKTTGKFSKSHKTFRRDELAKELEASGFKIERMEPFGYIAFAILGFPDILPVFKNMPFRKNISKILISSDKIMSKLPLIRNSSWHTIYVCRKVD